MTRALRKSTRKKTELSKARAERSIDAALTVQESFRAKAQIAENALLRKKQYPETGRLVPMKPPKHLEQRTIANAKSPLFRLPAEIRNMIFELALTLDGSIYGSKDKSGFYIGPGIGFCIGVTCRYRGPYVSYMEKEDKMLFAMALPRACRQAYQETATTFYTQNMIWLHSYKAMELWLSQRLPAQLRAIRHLRVVEDFASFFGYVEPADIDEETARMVKVVKASCPHLENVDDEHSDGCDFHFVYRRQ